MDNSSTQEEDVRLSQNHKETLHAPEEDFDSHEQFSHENISMQEDGESQHLEEQEKAIIKEQELEHQQNQSEPKSQRGTELEEKTKHKEVYEQDEPIQNNILADEEHALSNQDYSEQQQTAQDYRALEDHQNQSVTGHLQLKELENDATFQHNNINNNIEHKNYFEKIDNKYEDNKIQTQNGPKNTEQRAIISTRNLKNGLDDAYGQVSDKQHYSEIHEKRTNLKTTKQEKASFDEQPSHVKPKIEEFLQSREENLNTTNRLQEQPEIFKNTTNRNEYDRFQNPNVRSHKATLRTEESKAQVQNNLHKEDQPSPNKSDLGASYLYEEGKLRQNLTDHSSPNAQSELRIQEQLKILGLENSGVINNQKKFLFASVNSHRSKVSQSQAKLQKPQRSGELIIHDRSEIEENIRKHRIQEVIKKKKELENKLKGMESELKNLEDSAKHATKISPNNNKIMTNQEGEYLLKQKAEQLVKRMNADRKTREQREMKKRLALETVVSDDIQNIFERKENDKARQLTEKHKEILKKIEERERNRSIRDARFFAGLETVSSKPMPLYQLMEQLGEDAKLQELERRKQFLAERRQLYNSLNKKGLEAYNIQRQQELEQLQSEQNDQDADDYRTKTLNQRKYQSKILTF